MRPYKLLSGISLAVFDFEVNPAYKSAGFSVTRLIWFVRNWEFIVGLIILVVIILLLVNWVRKK
jgi:uncharacterized membrane protein